MVAERDADGSGARLDPDGALVERSQQRLRLDIGGAAEGAGDGVVAERKDFRMRIRCGRSGGRRRLGRFRRIGRRRLPGVAG